MDPAYRVGLQPSGCDYRTYLQALTKRQTALGRDQHEIVRTRSDTLARIRDLASQLGPSGRSTRRKRPRSGSPQRRNIGIKSVVLTVTRPSAILLPQKIGGTGVEISI